MIRRIVASLAIGALLTVLLVVLGWLWDRAAATYKPGVAISCINRAEDRERLKSLAIQALDEAFRNQIEHLYVVWMRDSRGQPQRAQLGTSNAITAWVEVRQAMAKFEPPLCARPN